MIRGLNFALQLPDVTRVSTSTKVGASSARAASENSAADNNASAKVIFGSQSSDIAAVYSLSPKKMSANAVQQLNPVIEGLMHTAQSSSSISSLATLGSTLLGNLKENRGDVTQAVTGVAAETASAANKFAVTLSVVTKSGSTVNLTMTQQDDGLAVEMKTEGEALSDDDAAAVASLGDALSKTLNGLGQMPPKLDIGGLTNFDNKLLQSVDLKTDVRNGEDSLQSLNFHADDKERAIAYQDGDFSLKMSSDLSKPGLAGSHAQQQQALKAYDDKFDKARLAGNGDRGQMETMKSVFRALNSTSDAESASALRGQNLMLSANGVSQLSGLNDFSLSFTQAEKSPNPAHENEKDRFSYAASQSSEVQAHDDGAKTVKQTTRSHLSAAWHDAIDPSIPLALNKMKSSQNYLYHLVENDDENTTTLNVNGRGMLTSVGHDEKVDHRSTVKKYVLDKMVDETVTPEKYANSSLRSFMATA
ncbi:hypothetical protein [Enterobacter sp. Bisph1]|uniref:hypothetical protein n=1 Tax=Enterobacter sp. Bisph1 TaxID=1274399 RepID=UPI00057C31BF|nr:hypothetical protein [Enterobacter sp. Bisph1]